MAILKIRDNDGNIIDIPAIKGDKGEKGDKGPQGDSYILTDTDKQDIAQIVIDAFDAELMKILGSDEQ